MNEEQIKRIVDDRIDIKMREYLKSSAFTDRKLTDMPTDALQVVSRKFVTLNGATSGRPTGSVLGQRYFDTSLGYPVYWSGTTWVKYDGTSA